MTQPPQPWYPPWYPPQIPQPLPTPAAPAAPAAPQNYPSLAANPYLQPIPPQPSPSAAPASPEPPQQPPPVVVNPPDNSRLDQLAAELAALQPRVERAEEIRKAIKAELQRECPGAPEVLLTSPHLPKSLRMRWVPDTTQIDSKALKAQQPEVHQAFSKPKRGYWDLRAVG